MEREGKADVQDNKCKLKKEPDTKSAEKDNKETTWLQTRSADEEDLPNMDNEKQPAILYARGTSRRRSMSLGATDFLKKMNSKNSKSLLDCNSVGTKDEAHSLRKPPASLLKAVKTFARLRKCGSAGSTVAAAGEVFKRKLASRRSRTIHNISSIINGESKVDKTAVCSSLGKDLDARMRKLEASNTTLATKVDNLSQQMNTVLCTVESAAQDIHKIQEALVRLLEHNTKP